MGKVQGLVLRKKRALETASVSRGKHQPTVVSSADGATGLSEPTLSDTASDVSKPQIPDNGGKESLNAETIYKEYHLWTVVPQSVILKFSTRQTPKIFLLVMVFSKST